MPKPVKPDKPVKPKKPHPVPFKIGSVKHKVMSDATAVTGSYLRGLLPPEVPDTADLWLKGRGVEDRLIAPADGVNILPGSQFYARWIVPTPDPIPPVPPTPEPVPEPVPPPV